MADRLDFQIDQGGDWNFQIVLQNDDGTPLNLTGCQAHLKCRAFPASPIVLIDLSTMAGTMTLNGPLAQLNGCVPGAQTALYTPQAAAFLVNTLTQPGVVPFGVYDLFVEMCGGQLIKYVFGQITLALSQTPPF
jgi:hypothetical protein